MKILLTSLISLLLAASVILILPLEDEEKLYDEVLRLHIMADSDETDAQIAKLLVRDAVLSTYADVFSLHKSKEEAEQYLEKNIEGIESTAKEALRSAGLDYPVSATLEREWFDTRTYTDFTLPAGDYTALKITLGEGKGQNFFCMLYPALCVKTALGDTVNTKEEAFDESTVAFVTKGGYAVKFRVLEFLSAAFEKQH